MDTFDPKNYWEQRLSQSKGLEGVGYLGLGQQFNAWMYRVRRTVFRRTVLRNVVNVGNLSVLDVGSGTGEYIRTWLSMGARSVTGSDLTEVAVSRLSKDFSGCSMILADIADPRFSVSEQYDAVSCMDVLFHVVDTDAFEQALANLRKAVTTGGYLVLSENFVHKANGGQEHFTQRTLATYEMSLRKHGFQIIERRPMFHLMNAPIDSDSRWLHRWWSSVMYICRYSYTLGGLLAMLVFPIEYLIVMFRREGVSTEIMVCRAI